MKLFLTKENHEKVLQAIDDHIEKDLKYKFEKMKALKTIQIEQKNVGEYESLEIRHADVIRVKEKKSFLDRIVEFKTYNLEEDFNITIGYSSIQNDKLKHLAKIREDLVTYLLFAEGVFKYRSEVEEYTDFEFDYDKLIQFIHLVHFYLATQREENPNALDYRNLGFEHCYRIDHLLGIGFNTALINEAYDDYYFDSDSIKEEKLVSITVEEQGNTTRYLGGLYSGFSMNTAKIDSREYTTPLPITDVTIGGQKVTLACSMSEIETALGLN